MSLTVSQAGNSYQNNQYQRTQKSTKISQEKNASEKTFSKEECEEIIHKKTEELYTKLKNGETETSYQIGAKSYTVKEWNKLMSDFDKAENKIKEQIRKEVQNRKEEQERKAEKKKELKDLRNI